MNVFTERGVNVIQFGSGDIEINAGILLDNLGVAISLIPLNPRIEPNSNIDRSIEHNKGMTDEQVGVNTRLVFTDSRSIDALIDQLQIAKNNLTNDINAHRESSNKNNLTHGDLFVKHIKSHLKDNQQVICKICGKSVDEIANMGGV